VAADANEVSGGKTSAEHIIRDQKSIILSLLFCAKFGDSTATLSCNSRFKNMYSVEWTPAHSGFSVH